MSYPLGLEVLGDQDAMSVGRNSGEERSSHAGNGWYDGSMARLD